MIVVVAYVAIAVHWRIRHRVEHHLANLQAWIQRQRMVQAFVLQFERQLASMPAWITPACEQMIQATSGSTALEHELRTDVVRQIEQLKRFS